MGTFNSIVINASCPYCGKPDEFEVQFKYAESWQYRYQLGDKLRWGNNGHDIGNPNYVKVKVEGISGPCMNCNKYIDLDVIIVSNVIVDVVVLNYERINRNENGFEIEQNE